MHTVFGGNGNLFLHDEFLGQQALRLRRGGRCFDHAQNRFTVVAAFGLARGVAQRGFHYVTRREIATEELPQPTGSVTAGQFGKPAGNRNRFREPVPQHQRLHQLVLHAPAQMAEFVEPQCPQ